jgi:hypothetical protein
VLVGFAVIMSALALHGLHHTSTVWLRSTLNGLAHPRGGFLRRAAFGPLTLLGRGVLRVEHYARAGISHWTSASSHVLANWLIGLRIVWHGLISEVEAIPHDVADALGYMRHRTIPHLINISLWPVRKLAHEAHRLAHAANAYAHHEAHRIWRGIDHLEHRLTARFTKLYHGIDQFVHHTVWPRVRADERRIAGVISRDLPRIRAEEKALSNRLSRLEKALGLGALTALLVRVLARRFPWLFCRNVTNVGKRVCGLDPSMIGDAFGLLVTAEMLTNFPELVRILQGVTRETTEAIKDLAEV